MRFGYHNSVFCMFLEFPDGSHEPIRERDIRNMKLELVLKDQARITRWMDPA